MLKKRKLSKKEEVIDIKTGLKGKIKFISPVNLRISGKFEGELETVGTLVIGEQADVKAKIIKGENIVILGAVRGGYYLH